MKPFWFIEKMHKKSNKSLMQKNVHSQKNISLFYKEKSQPEPKKTQQQQHPNHKKRLHHSPPPTTSGRSQGHHTKSLGTPRPKPQGYDPSQANHQPSPQSEGPGRRSDTRCHPIFWGVILLVDVLVVFGGKN